MCAPRRKSAPCLQLCFSGMSKNRQNVCASAFLAGKPVSRHSANGPFPAKPSHEDERLNLGRKQTFRSRCEEGESRPSARGSPLAKNRSQHVKVRHWCGNGLATHTRRRRHANQGRLHAQDRRWSGDQRGQRGRTMPAEGRQAGSRSHRAGIRGPIEKYEWVGRTAFVARSNLRPACPGQQCASVSTKRCDEGGQRRTENR